MYSLDETYEMVVRVIDDHPDAINPSHENENRHYCLYTKRHNDESQAAPHCLVGQLLKDAGLSVPDSSVLMRADEVDVVIENFDLHAVGFLSAVQSLADARDPWGKIDNEALNRVRENQ